MSITELRILPPFAIGRLGSADRPLDNYTVEDDPENPLGFRRIVGAPTFEINEKGRITGVHTPKEVVFKDGERIRPVAPFLEVFAVTGRSTLRPLTLELLERHGLAAAHVSWRVEVANRKVARRTGDRRDEVKAEIEFSDHEPQPLKGTCPHFVAGASIDFGSVRYIRPTTEFPGSAFDSPRPRG